MFYLLSKFLFLAFTPAFAVYPTAYWQIDKVEDSMTFSYGDSVTATEYLKISDDGRMGFNLQGDLISDGTNNGGKKLKLDVGGDIGAQSYCDNDGLNCFLTTDTGSPLIVISNNSGWPLLPENGDKVFNQSGQCFQSYKAVSGTWEPTYCPAMVFTQSDFPLPYQEDGDIVYNSDCNCLWCYENNVWQDCETSVVPVGGFSFDCGISPVIDGVFSPGANSVGSVSIPITSVTPGPVLISVNGIEVSGMKHLILDGTETSIEIDNLFFTGAESAGTKSVSVSSEQGTGTCMADITSFDAQFDFDCVPNPVVEDVTATVSTSDRMLEIPISNPKPGNVNISINQDGFTANSTVEIYTNSTKILVPLSYDGSGSFGGVNLSISSPDGIGSCTADSNILPVSEIFEFNCPSRIISPLDLTSSVPLKGYYAPPITNSSIGDAAISMDHIVLGRSLPYKNRLDVDSDRFGVFPINFDGDLIAGAYDFTVVSDFGSGSCNMRQFVSPTADPIIVNSRHSYYMSNSPIIHKFFVESDIAMQPTGVEISSLTSARYSNFNCVPRAGDNSLKTLECTVQLDSSGVFLVKATDTNGKWNTSAPLLFRISSDYPGTSQFSCDGIGSQVVFSDLSELDDLVNEPDGNGAPVFKPSGLAKFELANTRGQDTYFTATNGSIESPVRPESDLYQLHYQNKFHNVPVLSTVWDYFSQKLYFNFADADPQFRGASLTEMALRPQLAIIPGDTKSRVATPVVGCTNPPSVPVCSNMAYLVKIPMLDKNSEPYFDVFGGYNGINRPVFELRNRLDGDPSTNVLVGTVDATDNRNDNIYGIQKGIQDIVGGQVAVNWNYYDRRLYVYFSQDPGITQIEEVGVKNEFYGVANEFGDSASQNLSRGVVETITPQCVVNGAYDVGKVEDNDLCTQFSYEIEINYLHDVFDANGTVYEYDRLFNAASRTGYFAPGDAGIKYTLKLQKWDLTSDPPVRLPLTQIDLRVGDGIVDIDSALSAFWPNTVHYDAKLDVLRIFSNNQDISEAIIDAWELTKINEGDETPVEVTISASPDPILIPGDPDTLLVSPIYKSCSSAQLMNVSSDQSYQ